LKHFTKVWLGRTGRVLVLRVGRGDDGAVARKLLLHGLEKLFGVKLLRKALDGGERLAAIALLETCGRTSVSASASASAARKNAFGDMAKESRGGETWAKGEEKRR
jgi:hypothetical protein